MRIRTIKPEFFQSESLAKVSREVRLLAAALLPWSDDEGYFVANPRILAGSMFPLDDDGPEFVERGLQELVDIGYVKLFQNIGLVPKFTLHQKISHAAKSKLKLKILESSGVPPESSGAAPEDFGATPEPLRPDQGIDQGSGNRSGNRSGRAPETSSKKPSKAKQVSPEVANLGPPSDDRQPDQPDLLTVPQSTPTAEPGRPERKPTFVQELHALFLSDRELRLFELGVDPAPPDDDPNWSKTSVVCEKWLEYARDVFPDDEDGQRRFVKSFVLAFLEDPWGAGLMRRDSRGNQTKDPQPFPWNAVLSEKIWRRLADEARARLDGEVAA